MINDSDNHITSSAPVPPVKIRIPFNIWHGIVFCLLVLNIILAVGWLATASQLHDLQTMQGPSTTVVIPSTPSTPSTTTTTACATKKEKACQVIGVKARLLKHGTVPNEITENEIKLQIGNPRFVDIDAHHWSCIDGRHTDEVLTTPGGDAAEFITAAALFISRTDTPTDYSFPRLQELWYSFLSERYEGSRKFYMHTDEHAVEALAKALGISEVDLLDPDHAYRTQLLKLLILPDYVGCGHLKLMLKNPTTYGVPTLMLQNFIQLYYLTLWGLEGKAKHREALKMDVLPGMHDERAVVSLNHTGCDDMSPIVTSRLDLPHIFVNQPYDVLNLREEISLFFHNLSATNVKKKFTVDEFLDDLLTVFSSQGSFTVQALASTLPQFSVTVESKPIADDT